MTDWRTMRERRSSAGGPSNAFASTHHPTVTPIRFVAPRRTLYVDPATFYPVEIHNPEFRGVSSVTRFLTFEYLPRTPANLKLTDIRAQHPDAVETGSP